MRVQRLAIENRSTQGPAKRSWYERNSPEHLEAIQALVLAALESQGPGPVPRVAILGAGACTELPLREIVERAEEVVLVDLDEFALQQALRQLSVKLQGRVRLVIADVTGGVSQQLEQVLVGQRWQALKAQGADAVLAAAARCLERCEVPQPPVLAELRPGRCGVVISSLVVTQLWSYPLLDLTDLLTTIDPALAGQQHEHAQLGPAIERFRERVARGHLLLLAQQVRPAGRVVLITEDAGWLVPQAGQESSGLDVPLPLLPAAFPRLVEEVFEPAVLVREWKWISDWPTAVRAGRMYRVIGQVLTVRS